MTFFRFLLYFILFLFAFRMLRYWLSKFFNPKDEQKVYEQKSSVKKHVEEIEEAKFTEIKSESEKTNNR